MHGSAARLRFPTPAGHSGRITPLTHSSGSRTPPVVMSGPTTLGEFARSCVPRAAEWADEFVLARERVGAAEMGRLYRSVKRGDLTAVRPGVFLNAQSWAALDADLRHLTRVRAEALGGRTPIVFGVESAAALWRLPMIGPSPTAPCPPRMAARAMRSRP